jgi:hypothetical protein
MISRVQKEGVKAAFWWDLINASRLHPTDVTRVTPVNDSKIDSHDHFSNQRFP